MNGKHILCTGGAGYIGSHTVIHLIEAGYQVTILDNFVNSDPRVVEVLGHICKQKIPLLRVDLTDKDAVMQAFKNNKFDGVVHYAALKAVGESVKYPLQYYQNNLIGALNLIEAMDTHDCTTLVYSSSAAVYQPSETPLKETDAVGASNPYGHTKAMVEQMLLDVAASNPKWRVSILRYFNPIGAHPSGLVGENAKHPTNLLPCIQEAAMRVRPALNVFGNDWNTVDGTGVRDYIHVEDLAEGHIAALGKLFASDSGVCLIHNLGTGCGLSVLEVVNVFEAATGQKIPLNFVARRPGDLASVTADPSKANDEFKWKATRTAHEGCASMWKWQMLHPNGYATIMN